MAAQLSEFSARLVDLFGNPATADPTKLWGNLTLNPNGTVSIGSGLVMPDGYTSWLTPSGRNKIINGDMKVAQRAATAFANNNAGWGGPDRYFTSNSGAAGQFTQSQGTIVYGGQTRTAAVITVNTAPTSLTGVNFWQGFQQRIEGYNAYDLIGQPIAMSFIFNTNVTGTYCITLVDGAASQSYASTFSATANTPTKVTLLVPAPSTPLSIPNTNGVGMYVNVGFLNTGTYQTANQNVWQTTIAYTAPGATNWGATAGNFIAMTELQVEPGPVVTPFERVTFADNLLRCQRYYETGIHVFTCTGNNTNYYNGAFHVAKRASATMTGSGTASLTSIAGTADGYYWVYGGSTNANVTLTYNANAEL